MGRVRPRLGVCHHIRWNVVSPDIPTAFAGGQAVSRSWSADTYKRRAEAQSREEEERIRVVCAKMLYDTDLLNPSRAAPS
jgi:hypothetical protein